MSEVIRKKTYPRFGPSITITRATPQPAYTAFLSHEVKSMIENMVDGEVHRVRRAQDGELIAQVERSGDRSGGVSPPGKRKQGNDPSPVPGPQAVFGPYVQ